MTCGIYMLSWVGTHKVYVGQSLNIENRLAQHTYNMSSQTSSVKLNKAFREYGPTSLEILEVCREEDLDRLENYHIKLWDAVDDGFNALNEAGSIPRSVGELNGRAKLTNEQVEHVFNTLVDNPTMLFPKVSGITGVPIANIRSISAGNTHAWLSIKYPERYKILQSLIGTRKTHSWVSDVPKARVVSPLGSTFDIFNIKQFAIDNSLDPAHLGAVISGKEKRHKGWKLPNTVLTKRATKVVSPTGDTYIIENIRKFARENNLTSSNLCNLINKKTVSYKGWVLYIEKDVNVN